MHILLHSNNKGISGMTLSSFKSVKAHGSFGIFDLDAHGPGCNFGRPPMAGLNRSVESDPTADVDLSQPVSTNWYFKYVQVCSSICTCMFVMFNVYWVHGINTPLCAKYHFETILVSGSTHAYFKDVGNACSMIFLSPRDSNSKFST